MLNLRPFQIALLGVFGVVAIIAVVVLANFEGGPLQEEQRFGDRVVIWGTLSEEAVVPLLRDVELDVDGFEVVEYREIDPRSFEEVFVNAIADGAAPDAVLIPHKFLVTLRSKLRPISYDIVSERQFRDRYIDGAEIFARTDGVYALPLLVDPLVMYWNRDLFNTNRISVPPITWERIVNEVVPNVTDYDQNRDIVKSGLAFGEFDNVRFAKEILVMLMMQSGSRLVVETTNGYSVELDQVVDESRRSPLQSAVQFYTGFSNRQSALYSWNRSLEEDRTKFLAGDLALYFAPGSAYRDITRANPNLNFDAAEVPQGETATVKRTYGTFYGVGLVRASDNTAGTYAALQVLTSDQYIDQLSREISLVPATRSLIDAGASDPFRAVAFAAALNARGWLDPAPFESEAILAQMIDDVVSGRLRVTGAVEDALQRLRVAF